VAKQEIKVPDIGDYKNVDVIEVFVKVGDFIQKEASLISLETDKATMEVPSPVAGKVLEIKLKVGDKISEGSLILVLETEGAGEAPASKGSSEKAAELPKSAQPVVSEQSVSPAPSVSTGANATVKASEMVQETVQETVQEMVEENGILESIYASPSVRRFSRELGVDLTKVRGSGRKGRLMQEDVQHYVKGVMQGASGASSSGAALGLIPDPVVDFSKFGPIEINPLPRIKKISGANLSRNWVKIPHITLFDDADISDLESFRKAQKSKAEKAGIKLSPLPFIIKAVASGLAKFPLLNSSLSADGQNLVSKKYIHIGVAVDTPAGLVIAVVRNADKKGIFEIAKEVADMAGRAQQGKLKGEEMQGGTFTISSLGGLGTKYFTPIVNMPEVAILGVSKAAVQPVWQETGFVPRTLLPLSLSLDHRVVDGAEGAKFLTSVVNALSDLRELIL
jgi:pyruvate dehydrogenase E2 component (dihydrolipoamide acetyltransferase)